MALIELQLRLPEEQVERWSDALLDAGAAAVTIEDEDRDSSAESALFAEPGLPPPAAGWRNNRVSVLVEEGIDAERWLAGVGEALGEPAPRIEQRVRLQDEDWVRRTQEQFAPITVGRLAIVPSWHEPPDRPDCIVRIDPGVAFGTGAHPTTKLCLSWLERNLSPGQCVLDYGCGSGILSIAAAKLGARDVLGVDIDAQAVATARQNAQRNEVTAQYTVPEELALDPDRTFDLVVANILANPLIVLAPTLARRVRAGGKLVLSGILQRQAAAVVDAYQSADPRLRLQIGGEDEGWVLVCAQAGS